MRVITPVLLLMLVAGALRAQTWDVAFGERGPNGPVSAIAFHRGDVYIGGEFTQVDGVAANNVARFDGSRWSALGAGVNGRVNAIGASDVGIFVGGEFDSAGGKGIRALALYSEGAWSSLETAETIFDRSVNAIAIDGDDLFVGGEFQLTIDGGREQSIAVWSMRDRRWRGLDGGVRVRDASWGEVLAIATNDRYAYVAGLFTYVSVGDGEIASPAIARWDRVAGRWDALGGVEPLEPGALEVARALDVDGGRVYALGDFSSVEGVTVDGVARFDESSERWEDVGLVGLGARTAIAARSSQVFAANASSSLFPGDALVSWDGSGSWRESGAAIQGSIYAIAHAPNGDLYVGGEFASARGVSVRNIIRRIGGTLAVEETGGSSGTAVIRSLHGNVLTLQLPEAARGEALVTVHDVLGRQVGEYSATNYASRVMNITIGVDDDLPRVCVVTVRWAGGSETRILAP